MKLFLIAFPCALAFLCTTYAAYLAVDDQSKPWTGFQEGLFLTFPLDELESHYLCDVLIGNEAFQIDIHSSSTDDWVAAPRNERNLPQEYVNLINQHLKASVGPSGVPASNRVPSSHIARFTSKHVTPIISCQRPTTQIPCSVLQRRIGFMHVIDLLSILAVGLLAAAATGIAAVLRRHDHLKRPVIITHSPRMARLDQLHELPSVHNLEETEYVFDYIKSKLG